MLRNNHTIRFLVICIAIGIGSQSNIGFAKELLKNPSFEDGLKYWKQWWPKGRLGKIEPDGTIGRNGRHCAKITIFDAKGSRLSLYQEVNIDPKQTYVLSFSFYTRSTQNIDASVRIGAFDKNHQFLGYFCQKKLSPTANVWVDYKLIFNPPSNTDRVRIEFNFCGQQQSWLDFVSFSGVEPELRKKMEILNKNPHPLFGTLLIDGTAPSKPRIFPYWAYNNVAEHFRNAALRYGWQYVLSEQYKECAEHNLAPFAQSWTDKQFVDKYSVPLTCYIITSGQKHCWRESVKRGAQAVVLGRPSPNDPVFVQTCLESIEHGLLTEDPPPTFYLFFDEVFNLYSHIIKKEDRKNEFWKNANSIVKEKYGFGRFGIPDSMDDTNPFKWIAYLRWQAEMTVDTFGKVRAKLKEMNPKTLFLGPDEYASFCPLDWQRMGQVIDIQPGQLLCGASGQRRFNAGYLVKFYHDLTGKPVYPFLQFVKYGASPSVDTVYDWANQILRNGGEGLFVGAVEWFDRYLNHPKYAAPRKWQAVLDIIDTMQKMEKVRLPKKSLMALHFSSFTQMSRGRSPDQTKLGSAYALLGPRAKSWFTFTDDFQIERNINLWDKFRVVVMPDAKYISEAMTKAIQRFVNRGGILVVTDPNAFLFRIDGKKLDEFRKNLLGVAIAGEINTQDILISGKKLSNPGQTALKLKICDAKHIKTIARFADSSAAIVEHRIGKGKVWYFAFNINTDAAVDDIDWIEQWRNWLKGWGVPLDYDIWRFEIPKREKLNSKEFSWKCLTGNAIRFERNFPDVSMNIDNAKGYYFYKISPRAIPEKYKGNKIPFTKGLLTNRRKMLELKKNSSGDIKDKAKLKIDNWVIRFGGDEFASNTIIFDLSHPFDIRQCRITFSGQLPRISIKGSLDGKSWAKLSDIESQNADKDVFVAKSELSGRYRYIRFDFAQRKRNTTLTLSELDIWGKKKNNHPLP